MPDQSQRDARAKQLLAEGKALGEPSWGTDDPGQTGATLLPDALVPEVEKSLKEIEDLIFLKIQIAPEDPYAQQDSMPIYDPETRQQLPKRKTQTDHLIESRDMLKKALDDYYLAKMTTMHQGPQGR